MAARDLDPDLTRRTIRKLDLVLLPFLSILFLVNSLDRSNIGNAETAHFTRDAGLEPEDLNDAVAWFFIFFVALQPVGAAAGRKFGMSIWVPSVMTLWGICTILHIWVRRRWHLIAIRIMLGVLEAGFYPTAVSYLSLFYTRFEFGRRLGLFYGSYGIASAFGGILAFVVFSRFSMDDERNEGSRVTSDFWKPWQILFLVEGGLTVAIALIGFFWLPKSPGSAWFLTPAEREIAEMRIYYDRESSHAPKYWDAVSVHETPDGESDHIDPDEQTLRLLPNEQLASGPLAQKTTVFTADAGLSKRDILSTTLFLPLVIPVLIINIASAIPSTAFSIFLPLVLSSMNLSSTLYSNLLTAPPFLLSSAILYLFTHWSDKTRRRIVPILSSLCVIILGLILTLLLYQPSLSSGRAMAVYLALCILLSCCFIPSPLTVAWFAGNIPDPGKRAMVLGINGYGNLAGVFAAYIFSSRWRSEGYRTSFMITLGIVVLSLLGFALFRVTLAKINDVRSAYMARWREPEMDDEYATDVQELQESRIRVRNPDPPTFAIIGGAWWDRQVRFWVGQCLLGMSRKDSEAQQADEKFTFTYGY
ncbi:hypothetical protein FQN57_007158 [Myotisia sp. PD_48]|nr:hypothetical protein FQN57_007158 [Myotisia sp. PD_48]